MPIRPVVHFRHGGSSLGEVGRRSSQVTNQTPFNVHNASHRSSTHLDIVNTACLFIARDKPASARGELHVPDLLILYVHRSQTLDCSNLLVRGFLNQHCRLMQKSGAVSPGVAEDARSLPW